MNKLGYYGYPEFFNKYRDEVKNYLNKIDEKDQEIKNTLILIKYSDLVDSVINGCYRNYKFGELCLRLKFIEEFNDPDDVEDFVDEIKSIIYCHEVNLIDDYFGIPYVTIHDFNYMPYNILKLYKIKPPFVAITCIINDWRDLYNTLGFSYRDKYIYSAALYSKNKYYIEHQESLDPNYDEKYFRKSCFFYKLININYKNAFNEGRNYGIFDLDCYDEFYLRDVDTHIDVSNVSNHEIVNNFDIAYRRYLSGDRSNLVLSKIISFNSQYFIEIFKKYKPFLLFTRNIFVNPKICSDNYNICTYNCNYIKLLSGVMFDNVFELDEDFILEYSIYKIAVKFRVDDIVLKIQQLFIKNKKIYKILDFKNECYYDPPIELLELPIVGDVDLFKGDELNPYF